jgi:endonuclease/exonuclease/phosphatase family metal-dependent hydrolase
MPPAIPPLEDSEKIETGKSDHVATSTGSKLVIASYNIRYAAGSRLISGGIARKLFLGNLRNRDRRGRRNLARARRAFSEGRLLPIPDVIALQEADKKTARAGDLHVARVLAESLQMDWVHAPAGIPRGQLPKTREWWLDFEEPIALYEPGDTGVALLSRVALCEVTRIDLPWHDCPWRPRSAVAASVNFGSAFLRIINAHVDPHASPGSQLEQLETLMVEATQHQGPVVIVGDFNTLSKEKVVQTRSFFESHGYESPIPSGTPTWRGMGIRLHADWIFHKGIRIGKWGVARPLSASDHWPIWAELLPIDQS